MLLYVVNILNERPLAPPYFSSLYVYVRHYGFFLALDCSSSFASFTNTVPPLAVVASLPVTQSVKKTTMARKAAESTTKGSRIVLQMHFNISSFVSFPFVLSNVRLLEVRRLCRKQFLFLEPSSASYKCLRSCEKAEHGLIVPSWCFLSSHISRLALDW